MRKNAPDLPPQSWIELNDLIREADEATCQILLEKELEGRKRRQFVKRIYSRLNKVRADRERAELEERMS